MTRTFSKLALARRRPRLPVRLELVVGTRWWSLQLKRGVKTLATLGRRRLVPGRMAAVWSFHDTMHVESFLRTIPILAQRQGLNLGRP